MPADDALRCDRWVEVFAQAVPSHAGHLAWYPDGDPYADFLPPAIEEGDGDGEATPYRAVILVRGDRDRKRGSATSIPSWS